MQHGKMANYLNQTGIKMPGCVAPYASVGPVTTTTKFLKYLLLLPQTIIISTVITLDDFSDHMTSRVVPI